MGNSNPEWKKEIRLFGIVFWLLSLIDVFHIIIGILYSTVAETNGTLIITLMVYKAAVSLLKISLGAWIMRQGKSCEVTTEIRPQVLRAFLAAFAISLLLDIYYCFLISDLVCGLIEVCNSSIAFIPLLGYQKIAKQDNA